MAGWVDGGSDCDGVCQLLCHQGHAAHHWLQVQGGKVILLDRILYTFSCSKVLSVLYQYENLTEELEEDVKSGDKKRRPGGDNKVVHTAYDTRSLTDNLFFFSSRAQMATPTLNWSALMWRRMRKRRGRSSSIITSGRNSSHFCGINHFGNGCEEATEAFESWLTYAPLPQLQDEQVC